MGSPNALIGHPIPQLFIYSVLNFPGVFMNRPINPLLVSTCVLAFISIGCNNFNLTDKFRTDANSPWQSKAQSDIPFVKDGLGPFLAFSGTRIRDGKIQNEVNLYGFGMDRWENGKKVTSTWEKWELKCQDPCYTPMFQDKGIYCQLERIIIYKGANLSEIDIKRYSTLEGNLKITHADWQVGALDFEFGDVVDGNPTHCELRYKQTPEGTFLTSFRGAAIKRSDLSGNMFTVEYRPAEHSYTLNVPIAMTGMKSGMR